MITEMDISILPMPDWKVGADVSASFEYKKKLNPYPNGLPYSANVIFFEKRYLDFFKLFLKHRDVIIEYVMGRKCSQSLKNNFPVRGRTDYPLLFDRKNQAKPE